MLWNAIRDAGTGGIAGVNLSTTKAHATIRVQAAGRGIPTDEIPHWFDTQPRNIRRESMPGAGSAFFVQVSSPDLMKEAQRSQQGLQGLICA